MPNAHGLSKKGVVFRHLVFSSSSFSSSLSFSSLQDCFSSPSPSPSPITHSQSINMYLFLNSHSLFLPLIDQSFFKSLFGPINVTTVSELSTSLCLS